MKNPVWIVRVLASFAFVIVAAGAIGCGSTPATCMNTKRDYQCVNNACACTSGPNKDKSCCNPEDTNCAADKKCTKFCEYCASAS